MGTLRPTHASIKWPLNKYDPGKGDVGIMKLTAEKSFESDHFMRHPVFAYFDLTSMAAWDFVHLSISIASACFCHVQVCPLVEYIFENHSARFHTNGQ